MTIQMREFGKNIQVHRAFYVPAEKVMVVGKNKKEMMVTKKGTGRMNTKMLGSFKTKKLLTINDSRDFNSVLKDHEIDLELDEQIAAWEWAKGKINSIRLDRLAALPENLIMDLNELSMGLKLYSGTLTQEQFDAILNAVDDLKDAARNYKSLFNETKTLVVKSKKDRQGK